jgi:hypothetical protein
VGRRRIGAMTIGCLSLVLAACGGGGSSSGGPKPTPNQLMLTCLKRGGAVGEIIKVDSKHNAVGAHARDGDSIVIVNLPDPDLSEPAISAVKEEMRKAGLHGLMASSTLDQGSILIMVVGHEGLEAGVPSAASEELARRCAAEATRPTAAGQ